MFTGAARSLFPLFALARQAPGDQLTRKELGNLASVAEMSDCPGNRALRVNTLNGF